MCIRDSERALTFYRDVLGFVVEFTNGNPVQFAVVAQGNAELHIGVQQSKAGTLHAHLMVDGLDDIHAKLVAAGATIRQPPKVQPWGLRDMVVCDPDGNSLEIAEKV